MNDMTMRPYTVYVKPDGDNRITAINSSAFLPDTTGWVAIDHGYGDKYHHAQGNYLPKSIMDERGVYRYKLADSQVQERTPEEMDADYVPPVSTPDLTQQVASLEAQLDMLLTGVTADE